MGVSTQIVTGLSGFTRPAMAFGDFSSGQKSYLLTYSFNYNIWGVRVSEGGVALDSPPAICSNAGTQSASMPAFGLGPEEHRAGGWFGPMHAMR